jgi:GLPGLI family protein
MKNYMLKTVLVSFLMVPLLLSAQNFTGKATYKTHRKMDLKQFGGGDSKISETQHKQMEEQMKKMFQKTFILSFSKSKSIYKEDVKLNSPKPKLGGMSAMIIGSGGGSDILFKDVNKKRYVNKTEIMGKRFLIKDSIPNFKWDLSSETKNIGNYTCYKASFSREEEQTQLSMDDGEAKETTKKVKIVTIAWYTPEIPVSNGPREFGGLPGLILELNEGKLTIVCTEIVMNPSDKIKIEEPSKGKVISQEKYDNIMDEKSKEMLERFKVRKGSGKGHGESIEIRIGG